VHTKYMGGGFGRRARADYIGEAVEVSKALGAPVKLTWSREDDLQHDWYRPASYCRFTGAVDAEGWPSAWHTRIACTPFGGGARPRSIDLQQHRQHHGADCRSVG